MSNAESFADEVEEPVAAFGAAAGMNARPTRHVFVHGLELMASVGVYELEKRYEQRIVVSVDLAVADDYDGMSDRLDDVLDYGAVVRGVQRAVAARHVNLIETLAERIAELCLEDARVCRVRVRIEKPDAFKDIGAVGIAITRRR